MVSRQMGFTGWWTEWVMAVAQWGGEEGRGGGEIEVVGEVVIGDSSRRYQWKKKKKSKEAASIVV